MEGRRNAEGFPMEKFEGLRLLEELAADGSIYEKDFSEHNWRAVSSSYV